MIDAGALVELVWVAFIAGVGLVTATSVAIAGLARAAQARRTGRRAEAAANLAVALAAGLACLVALVLGVGVMAGL